MKISRVIHQTVENMQQVLPEYANNRDFLSRINPTWQMILYTSDDREDFIRSTYDLEVLKAYLSIDSRYGAARADFFRYLVVYDQGGLYLDVKATAYKPLDTVVNASDTFVTAQWPLHIDGIDTSKVGIHDELAHPEYQNWFILGAQKSVVLENVIATVLSNINRYSAVSFGVGKMGVIRTTGPIAYSNAIHNFVVNGQVRLSTNEELGFRPTIHPITSNRAPFPNRQVTPHYSSLKIPIVKKSKFQSYVTAQIFRVIHKAMRGWKRFIDW
jgi:mannosyltransferase OCH1-like enzyme